MSHTDHPHLTAKDKILGTTTGVLAGAVITATGATGAMAVLDEFNKYAASSNPVVGLAASLGAMALMGASAVVGISDGLHVGRCTAAGAAHLRARTPSGQSR